MSKSRLELHNVLKGFCDNVYFQPPETIKLKYPCIIYGRDDLNVKHANDNVYMHMKKYTITVIDPDPDTEIPDMMIELPYGSFDRSYTADNLNHYILNLFY